VWVAKRQLAGALELTVADRPQPVTRKAEISAAIEDLRDTIARWRSMRRIRDSAVFAGNEDPALAQLVNVPNIDLYAIDVSFSALKDKAEFDYLNDLPTSFVLPPEAVDRLRAAAGTIISSSPEFKRLLKDSDLDLVTDAPTP
jgi:NTE family protein